MPKLVKLLTHASQQLQTQLLTSREQLIQQQNPEALHQLRISLRQLRSLLRPLRADLDEAMAIDGLVKKTMKSTNHIRDCEVLICELRKLELFELAQGFQQGLQAAYLNIAQQPELTAIQQKLLKLIRYWQKSLSPRTAHNLELHICEQWQQQSQKLFKSIHHKKQDKHRLRVLLKRLRYTGEAYQTILPKSARAQTQQFRSLQELLGTWHDYVICIAQAQQQTELQVLIPIWQQQLKHWEHESDQALKKLKQDNSFS